MGEYMRLQEKFDLGGRLGLSLYSFKQKKWIVNYEDSSFYTPASCLKIITTGAGFHYLEPNYFPKTKINVYGNIQNKILKGSIQVIGGGDPNISARFYPNENYVLDLWASKIKALGIEKIEGDFIYDESYFGGYRKSPHWKKRHFNHWFGAEVSALSYNDNCFTVKIKPDSSLQGKVQVEIIPEVGYIKIENEAITVSGHRNRVQYGLSSEDNILSITGQMGIDSPEMSRTLPVRDPKAYFGIAFEKALEKARIKVEKSESPFDKKTKPIKTLELQTVPITNVMEDINQRSQNLHAEILLRHVSKSQGGDGSAEDGILQVKKFLHSMDLDSSEFQLHDGSGLSHLNRIKPRNMAMYLHKMSSQPYFTDYIKSLATPGIHGNRSYRLNALNGLVKMKTGYIDPVQGLCGFVFSDDNDTLSFSFFINGFRGSARKAGQLIDSLITATASWANSERAGYQKAAELYQAKKIPKMYMDRLQYFSKVLMGSPYYLGPTGEGRNGVIDDKPLMDLNRFDCVTYIESSMGLAMSKNPDELLLNMQRIRYMGDSVSYINRKHFFIQDWVLNSPQYARIFRFPGKDELQTRTMGKKKFFKMKDLEYPLADPAVQVPVVSMEKAQEIAKNWKYGKRFLGVAFVTKIDWLWVSHTGFLDVTDGKNPILRHASSNHKKVSEEPFLDYLKSREGKCPGVIFFEFNHPE